MQVLSYFAGHGHEKDNVPQLCGIGWKGIDIDEDVIDPPKKSGKNLFIVALVDRCRVHDEDDVSEPSAPAPAVHSVVTGTTPGPHVATGLCACGGHIGLQALISARSRASQLLQSNVVEHRHC